jgi:mRNA interferase HigB
MTKAIAPSRPISPDSSEKLVDLRSIKWNFKFHFWELEVMRCLHDRYRHRYRGSLLQVTGHRGIKAARSEYDAWLAIAGAADWKTPEEVKKAHSKASVLKGSGMVFNIKAYDYQLIALVQYVDGVLMIRFFASHEEYDGIDAETV